MKWIYRHPRLYDFLDWFISLSMSGRARRKAIGGLVTDSFLEIGAGSGKSLCLVDSNLMIGLDTSIRMLRYARRRFPNAVVVIGDAHRLPFGDSCIDVSVFSYCLRSLARPAEAVREALRVSSRVVIIDYDRPTFLPTILWERIANRLGCAVFGSRDLDFEELGHLAQRRQVRNLYGDLYKVMVLEGVNNAGS